MRCPEKIRYPSENAAKVALVGIVIANNQNPQRAEAHKERRPYPCKHCGGWHLTSQPKGSS